LHHFRCVELLSAALAFMEGALLAAGVAPLLEDTMLLVEAQKLARIDLIV